MIRQALVIDLLDDCVFSARSATAGGHESLDRIPGSALLGAAASAIYGSMDGRDAYKAFHSAGLRFGDGLPLRGTSVGWPVPLCWYHSKVDRPSEGGLLKGDRIHNLLHGSAASQGSAELKQMRTGYVHADGCFSEPVRRLRTKTGIDVRTGRAAEGQLFSYEAIASGQRFVSYLQADEGFDRKLFDRVLEGVSGGILLGRSRSAEFGRAQVTPTSDVIPETRGSSAGRVLTLWLLSDLALGDTFGQPSLEPSPASFALGNGSVKMDKSFFRSRRYSPWNAARQGYDRERVVIAAGGVITLDLDETPTESQLRALEAGVGLYREAGLGRVWVNSPLLEAQSPAFGPQVASSGSVSDLDCPNDPLIQWLQSRDVDWKSDVERRARSMASEFLAQVESARRAAGVPWDVDFGPSRAQWGRVLEAARNASGEPLGAALFGLGSTPSTAIIKRDGKGWKENAPDGKGKWLTLAEWIKARLEAECEGNSQARAHLVRQLAHRVRAEMGKRRP